MEFDSSRKSARTVWSLYLSVADYHLYPIHCGTFTTFDRAKDAAAVQHTSLQSGDQLKIQEHEIDVVEPDWRVVWTLTR